MDNAPNGGMSSPNEGGLPPGSQKDTGRPTFKAPKSGLADDQERGPVICLRGEFFRNLALAEN